MIKKIEIIVLLTEKNKAKFHYCLSVLPHVDGSFRQNYLGWKNSVLSSKKASVHFDAI